MPDYGLKNYNKKIENFKLGQKFAATSLEKLKHRGGKLNSTAETFFENNFSTPCKSVGGLQGIKPFWHDPSMHHKFWFFHEYNALVALDLQSHKRVRPLVPE